jgi:outer membrane PBP1 activator LpoA protein
MNIFEVKIFNHIKKKITKTLYLIIFSSLIILSCQTTQSTTKVLNNNSNIEKTLSDFPITKTEFEENEEIRVGLLLPMKGQNYRIGKSLLNAIHLALYKTQNKNIKIFVRDTSSIEGVTKAYYEFLDLNIDIILGPVFSDKVNELKSLSSDNKIQTITFSNNLNIANQNIFISGLTLNDEIKSIINYAENNNLKKFAIIAPENTYGNTIIQNFEYSTLNKDISILSKVFFDPKNPDFYEVAKLISDYENRSQNLLDKIELLKKENSERSKKEIKALQRNDTYGDLQFDSLYIAVESFQQLSLLSSTLPYYDVDPKKIQYFGTSFWNKYAIIKEPGLNNSIFVSLEKDKTKIFNDLYQTLYNEIPHPIAIYGFDAVGIISSLNNQNLKINNENILSEMGFSGLTGMFKFKEDGIVERKLALYRIKNEKIIKIKN